MRLTFQHTLSDILELNCSVREQRICAWLVLAMAFAGWSVGIWLLLDPENHPEPWPMFLAAGMFTLLGMFATRLAGFGAWLFKARRTPYDLEIGEEGITFLMDNQEVWLPWELFSRWLLTKNLLVLVSPLDALAIPKRSCDDAEWAELLSLVRGELGYPARW